MKPNLVCVVTSTYGLFLVLALALKCPKIDIGMILGVGRVQDHSGAGQRVELNYDFFPLKSL